MLFKGVSQHFSSLGTVVAETPPAAKSDDSDSACKFDRVEERIRSVRLQGNGAFVQLAAAAGGTKTKVVCIPAEPDLRCLGCSRASRLTGQCQNCSTVDLCEHCGFGCAECSEVLCSNCVNLL